MEAKQIKYIPSMGRLTVKLKENDSILSQQNYSLIAEVVEIGPSPDGRPLAFGVGDQVKLSHLQGHAWEYNGEVHMTLNVIDVESKVVYEDLDTGQ